MLSYILRRLLSGVLILFILSLVVFVLLRVVSGDKAGTICGLNCTEAGIKAARHLLGLDKPYFPIGFGKGFPFILFHPNNQYMTWIKDLATGHLGNGHIDQAPIIDTIRHRLPVTLELLIITVMFTVAIGVPAGVISALYRNSIGDHVVRVAAVLGLAVPSFWVATLVIYFPSHWWGYAPPFGRSISFFQDPWGNLRQFVPPAAVLGLASAAGIMRLTRSSLLEVMRTDYIRTARSKGLRETSVVARHALKNSLIPVITVLGLQVAGLLGGAVIIEQIFALPGLGLLEFQSLLNRDYQVVQSLTLYLGAAVILMNLLVDVSYAWLDPRIRYS
jgi:peptide/nickel transport system permease protein